MGYSGQGSDLRDVIKDVHIYLSGGGETPHGLDCQLFGSLLQHIDFFLLTDFVFLTTNKCLPDGQHNRSISREVLINLRTVLASDEQIQVHVFTDERVVRCWYALSYREIKSVPRTYLNCKWGVHIETHIHKS